MDGNMASEVPQETRKVKRVVVNKLGVALDVPVSLRRRRDDPRLAVFPWWVGFPLSMAKVRASLYNC